MRHLPIQTEKGLAGPKRLHLETIRTDEGDYRGALTAFGRKIQSSAPISLPANQEGDAKLYFLSRTVNGLPWAQLASFRLPDIHSNEDITMLFSSSLRNHIGILHR